MKPVKKESTEIVKYNTQDIVKFNTLPDNFKHISTIQLAVNDECDSLAIIRKKVGKNISLNIIKIWIINLNDFLNISRKMNPEQINQTAELIYDEFYYFKVSDIALLMKRIKTGHYGQFYESIDGMKLMDMFFKYAQERIDNILIKSEFEERELKYKNKESFRK